MATKYRKPALGRAYDYLTGKLVNNVNDLYNPQGGGDLELMRQWHLKELGDIGTIWRDFTGKGVSVGVYDEGTQQAHWDLDDNYDASKHVVIDGKALNGGVVSGAHGTAVGGLIAAERNGRGGVGVAYDAKVTGVDIFDPKSPININGANSAAMQCALMQANQFDVANHSWGGGSENYAKGSSRSNPDSFSSFLARTFEYAAETGRDGLGTVTVMAAGNDAQLGQNHSGVTDRHVIAVGAYRQVDGVSSYYSNYGPHLLVSAPSSDFSVIGGTGVVTADLLGTNGYNWSADPGAANDYTDGFGGTSAATPIVSGVVSLMLDANENLGWRDVQNILATSAKMPVAFETGPVAIGLIQNDARVEVLLNKTSFKLNGADANWNGGAMHYSNDYGYGAVDAYNAVRMAEVWGLFAEAKTSANEVHVSQSIDIGLLSSSDTVVPLDRIAFNNEPLGNPVQKAFQVDSNLALERIDLTVSFLYDSEISITGNTEQTIKSWKSDVFYSQFKLTAPDGSTSLVPVTGSLFGGEGAPNEFTFSFTDMRGIKSQGEWTFDFSALDFRGAQQYGPFFFPSLDIDNRLTVNSIKLDMYGSAVTNDDVHTYTNEFFTMVDIAGQDARTMLSDTNGGIDWINAAAVSHNVALSLVGGQTTTFDGEDAFTITRNSVIENAVTGDGNDTLIGNRFDNYLVAMRGDDVLNGGAGNDWLLGGTGSDRFLFDNRGTSGKDVVLDFTRGDMIGTQTALRGAAADGKITVASNTLLLLDGTRFGDTAQLSQQGGAVIQSVGQKDGYFWYSFVSGTDIKMGEVIREESFQPTQTAAGMVDAIMAMSGGGAAEPGGTITFGDGEGLTGPVGEHGSFYLYDAMAGSMNGGVLLAA